MIYSAVTRVFGKYIRGTTLQVMGTVMQCMLLPGSLGNASVKIAANLQVVCTVMQSMFVWFSVYNDAFLFAVHVYVSSAETSRVCNGTLRLFLHQG